MKCIEFRPVSALVSSSPSTGNETAPNTLHSYHRAYIICTKTREHKFNRKETWPVVVVVVVIIIVEESTTGITDNMGTRHNHHNGICKRYTATNIVAPSIDTPKKLRSAEMKLWPSQQRLFRTKTVETRLFSRGTFLPNLFVPGLTRVLSSRFSSLAAFTRSAPERCLNDFRRNIVLRLHFQSNNLAKNLLIAIVVLPISFVSQIGGIPLYSSVLRKKLE